MKAQIVAINLSEAKGTKKKPGKMGRLVVGHGIEGDAHAGAWHRQVSLLAEESIQKIRDKGLPTVGSGDFAENITTRGLELHSLAVGTHLRVGAALLEITQIGKECHRHCEIFHTVGDCVMPREGVFARVIEGGEIGSGDEITVVT